MPVVGRELTKNTQEHQGQQYADEVDDQEAVKHLHAIEVGQYHVCWSETHCNLPTGMITARGKESGLLRVENRPRANRSQRGWERVAY